MLDNTMFDKLQTAIREIGMNKLMLLWTKATHYPDHHQVYFHSANWLGVPITWAVFAEDFSSVTVHQEFDQVKKILDQIGFTGQIIKKE